MILNYDHVDIKELNSNQKQKMQNGLCPMCSNDTFKRKPGFFSNEFLHCTNNKCEYISGTHIFKPRYVI
jgi:ssDNA-binding Zn-finger/Zn-ribbon topoisomerase 1